MTEPDTIVCSHCMRATSSDRIVYVKQSDGWPSYRSWIEPRCPDCTDDFIHDSFWGSPPECNGECWTFGDQIAARQSSEQ